MALSNKKRQKKQEKKNIKRKMKTRGKKGSAVKSNEAEKYAHFPIHECLVQDTLFRNGQGSVLISRKINDGRIVASLFLVDTFCLGIKNAMFTMVDENIYEMKIKQGMLVAEGAAILDIDPPCVKKILVEAENYARSLGFSPHRDYHKVKGLLGSLEESDCSEDYTFGKNEKPFYVQGISETEDDAQKIIKHLEKVCGRGEFHYILADSRG